MPGLPPRCGSVPYCSIVAPAVTGAAPLPGRRPRAGSADGKTTSGRRFGSPTLRAVVQSVELLLEPEAERGVVRVWEALSEAGPAVPGAAHRAEQPSAYDARRPVRPRRGDGVGGGRCGPWPPSRRRRRGARSRCSGAGRGCSCGCSNRATVCARLQAAVADAVRRSGRQPLLAGAVDAARHAGAPGGSSRTSTGPSRVATALAQREAPAGMRVVASAVRRWDGSRRVEWEVGRPAQT